MKGGQPDNVSFVPRVKHAEAQLQAGEAEKERLEVQVKDLEREVLWERSNFEALRDQAELRRGSSVCV